MEDKHYRQREQQIFQEHTWLLQGGQYAHRGVSEGDRVVGNKVREPISPYSLLIPLSTTPSPRLLASHLSAPVWVQAFTTLALSTGQQQAQHFTHCRCSIRVWWWHVWVTFSRTWILAGPSSSTPWNLCLWLCFPLALHPLGWNFLVKGNEVMFTHRWQIKPLFYYKLIWHKIHWRYTSLLHKPVNRKIHWHTRKFMLVLQSKFKQMISKEYTGYWCQ